MFNFRVDIRLIYSRRFSQVLLLLFTIMATKVTFLFLKDQIRKPSFFLLSQKSLNMMIIISY